MVINFESEKTEILLNPRTPSEDIQNAKKALPTTEELKNHVWLATSGSTASNPGEIKYVALSKKALLVSAKAVNDHLQSDSSDIWINPLPSFHVGGLGIWARSFLSGAKVIPYNEKWDPNGYQEFITVTKGTFSSLVPAQVFDLVQQRLTSPSSLKGIVVGGGSLDESLYLKATKLGWNLLPSYGMTESCSQIATAHLKNSQIELPSLQILPHFSVQIDSGGGILLAGASLFTTYAYIKKGICNLVNPKENGWFKTEDKGSLNNGHLTVFGRDADFIKIGGENVDMLRLEKILNKIKLQMNMQKDIALVAMPDPRLGHVIHLAVVEEIDSRVNAFVEEFNAQVYPYEKIRKVHSLESIPRSALQKLLRQQLINNLQHVQHICAKSIQP